MESLPGVEAAGLTTNLPFTGRDAPVEAVSPGCWQMMRIPVLAGRAFTGQDAATEDGVILINERMARGQWPNASPIGRRTRLSDGQGAVVTIVGVVGDVRQTGVAGAAGPRAYRFYLQAPAPRMSLAVRSELDPTALTEAVRKAV